MDTQPEVRNRAERRLFNRKLVLFVHVLAAFFTVFIYLNRLDLSHIAYWNRQAGVTTLLLSTPAIFPYVISAIHAWRTATSDRLRVFLFLLVFFLGVFIVGCVMVGAFGLSVDTSGLFWTFGIQAAVYFFAAEFLFDVDED